MTLLERVSARGLRPIWPYVLVFYATFTPTFRPWLGTAGAILVNGGLLVLGTAALAQNRFRIRFLDRREGTALLVLVAAQVYYLFAICAGSLLLADTVVFRDLFELHKPVLYLIALLLPFVLIREQADVRRLERVMGLTFAGIAFLATLQFTNIVPVGLLYTKPINVAMGRVTVPFWNPYDFGFGVSVFLYWFALRYLRSAGALRLGAAGLALILIVLTQSRTMVGTVAGSLAVLVPLALVLDRSTALRRLRLPAVFFRYGAYALAVIGLGIAAYLLVADRLGYLILGFQRLILEGEQSSLNIRIAQFMAVVRLAAADPLVALFGNGVSKGSELMVESGYAFFLYRYGVMGFLLIFLAPLVFMLLFLARLLVEARDPHKDLAAAVFVWSASLFVASVGNNFSEQFRISFYYYFLFGFSIRYYYLTRGAGPAPSRPRRATGPASLAGEPA